ncbi:unnamed protein product [Bursaphelenchus okinawaensis]|uniref:Tyrosine-protein phosphatase domain-containing protein n=1 Tax=Bursaphelenchus okinawaensis TaxID=465554 RepID=A0A811L7G7_9BILA|nr:unnamed protein product [Bursaphelenchus okinawaensis]CAG9119534.1 unnamed protein product [Bursaphelenchus okinawaensis]
MGDKVATIPTLGRRKLNDTALSNLNKFTTKYSNLEYAGIVAEFEEIQKESATLEKPEFKAFKENAARNKDTVENCPDATRVVLTCNVPPATDYYNGNHIRIPQLDRPFMAVQTPMKNTINDFWRLVFQEACSVVLLLGDTKESDTGDFWPVKAGDHTNYGDIFVNNRKVTKLDDFTVSAIEVLPDGCSNSVIANLVHYPQWSEKEAPKEHFLAFLRCWKQIPRTLFVDAPIAVASRMGQGRSGAVILLHAAVEAIATGKECDLKSILKEMRKQRPFLVATPEQYNWVIKKVILYFSMKVSEVREPLATLLKNQLPK